MNAHRRLLLGISATVALGVMSAPVTPSYAQATTCQDLVFASEITNRFPRASDACLGVVEKDGRQFAKFTARIERVSGGTVHARFRMPDGSLTDSYSFNPPSNSRVQIGSRSFRFRDLSRGQEVNVYLPPDRFALATHEDETADFEQPTVTRVVIVPLAVAPASSSSGTALPSTASPLPLVGLLGGTFVLLGAGLTVLRRRG